MQFHYAFPEAVSWNRGAARVLGFDETGFTGAGADAQFVLASPGMVSRVLSDPGRAHAVYLEGRGPAAISVDLEKGTWRVDRISPRDGTVVGHSEIRRKEGGTVLVSPPFLESITVRLRRQ